MPWFKVDDSLSDHVKIMAAGNAAVGLWVRAGAWSARQLSDGFIPDQVASSLGTRGQAQRLLDVGLWDRTDGGYQFHGWDQWQPTRADVEKRRAEWRERQRKAREGKGDDDVTQ